MIIINHFILEFAYYSYRSFIELSREKKIILGQNWQDNKRSISPIELRCRLLGTRPSLAEREGRNGGRLFRVYET